MLFRNGKGTLEISPPPKWAENPRKGKNITHVRFVFNPVVVVVFVLNNYFFQKNSWSLKLTFRLPGSSCIANSIAKGQMDDGEVRKLSLLLLWYKNNPLHYLSGVWQMLWDWWIYWRVCIFTSPIVLLVSRPTNCNNKTSSDTQSSCYWESINALSLTSPPPSFWGISPSFTIRIVIRFPKFICKRDSDPFQICLLHSGLPALHGELLGIGEHSEHQKQLLFNLTIIVSN